MNQIAIRCPMRETHPVRTQPAEMLTHQAQPAEMHPHPIKIQLAKMLTARTPTTKMQIIRMRLTEMNPIKTV